MRIKTKMIIMALLGTVAHGIVCAESTPNQANGQPVPARRYDVAAYVWPAYQFKDERWNQIFKQGIGEWEIIRECKPGFPGHEQPNVPLWGYEDESDPKVMEKKIATAVKYGVNVFIYDWYWYDNQPFLEKGINDGFIKAKNCQDIQFYLMWANHDGGSSWDKKKSTNFFWPGAVDRATFDTVVDRVISKYMSQPNYYKIDGKPVFSVYELGTLIKGLGGVEQTRDALASFRSKVKAAGFPDLHFQTILWGQIPASVSQVPGDKTQSRNNTMTTLGIDSLTSYQWCHTVGPSGPYSAWADRAVGQWSGWAKEYSMPYFPHVSVGWDTNPRRNAYDSATVVERSPERFQAALESARQHVDQQGLRPRLITINSWNEWSEGSCLEPDERYGFKFLEAVKNVFGADGSGRSVSATPQWIWAPEPGQSALNALSGKRWFRATYTVPANRALKAATVRMTVDNEFTLFINGQQIGAGTDWQRLFTADITQVVKPGPLVIAVAATNHGAPGERGPAGMLGCVQLDFTEGEPLRFSTSEKWGSRDQEVPGWQDPNNQTGTWTPVEVIGHNGTAPWKWFALNGRGN